MAIYAIKAANEPEYVNTVIDSLMGGEGRFGWSYVETANLRHLHDRVTRDGWRSLTEDEQDCYQYFLLQLQADDYVVYINVPKWGKCTLAQVTRGYFWRWSDDDFNHRFNVDPVSVRTFDRNDPVVHPALRARLKLQGRWWTIYTEQEFFRLLDFLKNGEGPTSRNNLEHLSEEIQSIWPTIAEKIQHTHPGKDLECLVKMLFEKVPGVGKVARQKGSADVGADLVVEFEIDAVPGLVQKLVVQVKSYTGTMNDTSAINDIRRALKYYGASMGLIVSTATSVSKSFRRELDRLQDESKRPVALLIGNDLAAFFLRYGSYLVRE